MSVLSTLFKSKDISLVEKGKDVPAASTPLFNDSIRCNLILGGIAIGSIFFLVYKMSTFEGIIGHAEFCRRYEEFDDRVVSNTVAVFDRVIRQFLTSHGVNESLANTTAFFQGETAAILNQVKESMNVLNLNQC